MKKVKTSRPSTDFSKITDIGSKGTDFISFVSVLLSNGNNKFAYAAVLYICFGGFLISS